MGSIAEWYKTFILYNLSFIITYMSVKKLFFVTSGLLAVLLVWFTCSNCRAIKRQTHSSRLTDALWDCLLHKDVRPDVFVE